MAEFEVKVADKYQTYTASFGKVQASSTSGAEQAVSKLAIKLLGTIQRFSASYLADGRTRGVQWWRITVDETQCCRVCGCTWSIACSGGCGWVESDLCSSCAQRER